MTTLPSDIELDAIVVDVPAEGVARIRINRPDKRNALSMAVRYRIIDELRRLDSDDTVRAIIIAGGEKIFAAGADIKEMLGLTPTKMLMREAEGTWAAFAAVKKPLVAAVRGAALGGGFELAMICDIVVAGDKARFGLPEVKLGLIPGGGGTQRLIRVVGKHLALDLMLTGRTIYGKEAMSHGIVSRCVDDADVEVAAVQVGMDIAAVAPLAARMAKDSTLNGFDGPLSTGIALERNAMQLLLDSEDFREGVAAFMERRTPKFNGR